MLTRWAAHMTKGAVKYGRENWRLANSQQELDRFKASAFRHLVQWLAGERDEDHASAVLFNVSAAEFVLERIESGGLTRNAQRRAAGITQEPPPF